MTKVILKRGRAKPLWHGHPWVYAQAVGKVEGELRGGEIVDVVDHLGGFVGRGTASPDSAIFVRILTRDAAQAIDGAWIRARLAAALEMRRVLGLPSADTDCFRWVNSEGDGLSGLVVDVYGETIAVQFTSGGMYGFAEAIFAAIDELLPAKQLIEVAPGSFAAQEGIPSQPRTIRGDHSAIVRCREHGLSYELDLLAAQKTGLYLDQRDNHKLVGELAAGRRVLDLYAYHGGFALNAARGGATKVWAVDGSARAVATIAENATRNALAVEAIEADAFRYLAELPKASVDLMVLDPPKFARNRRERDAALKGYRKLHQRAIAGLAPGGLLASAVCAQLVELEELERIIANVAVEQGRYARLLTVRGAGPDHPRPASFVEGDYLKFVLCQLD